MKKWLKLFMVCLLAFILAGCEAGKPGDPTAPPGAGIDTLADAKPSEGASGDEEYTDTRGAAEGGTESDMVEAAGQETNRSGTSDSGGGSNADSAESGELPEDGVYTSRDDVALYIHLYGCLPSNFITKKEAEKLGWEGGSLEPYAPGKCIGGNRFGNYEGLLPEKDGRTYTECDIDTLGEDRRGAKRIVFSNDGLIYYTEDHYESFELLYGED